MEEIFAVRNVDPHTKKVIRKYAAEHEVNTAEALRDITRMAEEQMHKKREKKKYKSFFDTYDKLKFSGDPHLSEKIDEILYGE